MKFLDCMLYIVERTDVVAGHPALTGHVMRSRDSTLSLAVLLRLLASTAFYTGWFMQLCYITRFCVLLSLVCVMITNRTHFIRGEIAHRCCPLVNHKYASAISGCRFNF